MVDFVAAFIAWILNNMIGIAAIAGVAVLGVFVIRMFRKTPKNPDYVKIWADKSVEDEVLNVPDRLFGLQYVFRGERLLGKIMKYDEQKVKINPTPENPDEKKEKYAEGKEQTVCTITFRQRSSLNLFLGKIQQILCLLQDFKTEGNKIVFPSSTGFTSLGNHYIVKSSYPEGAKVVEMNWARRFAEAQANAFGNQMLKISGLVVEYAEERRLRELEIEKLRAEKQIKSGNII
jgi:hypothetical protein